jgi:hypothetical protein
VEQPSPPIDESRVPSLALIEHALGEADDSYRERANSLDTKAGVILSAAGVIVAVVGVHAGVAATIGQTIAVAAGVAAVAALLPRVDKAIGPAQLRDRYLTSDPTRTRLIVLNTGILLHEANERRLFIKFARLKIAAGLLLGSALAIVCGGIVTLIRH